MILMIPEIFGNCQDTSRTRNVRADELAQR